MTQTRGFTLVEMLMVMAVIAILSLTFPAIQSALMSNGFRADTSDMSDVLEGAYSAALAKNTYVWVGFAQMPNNGGLELAGIYSKSGSPGDISTTDQGVLFKPVVFQSLNLTTITSTQISNAARIPASSGVGQLFDSSNLLDVSDSTNTAAFSAQISGAVQNFQSAGTAPYFTTIMEITPSGQVTISSSNKYPWIEVGLQPLHGNGKDVAVLQMNAFTGRVVQFLP